MIDLYLASDKILLKEIGHKIKRLRIAANLSQKALAERSGVSVFSISQIENGSNPSLLTLLMILRSLNALNMLYLFFEEEQLDPIAIADYLKSHPQPKRASSSKSTNIVQSSNPESEW
ncbi:MAG: helix-turn-helix transcriptional regulator [Paludibacteraceae bacterium]|nr:helix-turn-helix transcriptional regulator [Paludibacteraceae bacterium]